jgi:uncharacterized protein YraI
MIHHHLVRFLYLGVLTAPLGMGVLPPRVAYAQQRSDCTVRVIGRTQGSRVNLRSGPGTKFSAPSYILVGQSVRMLNDRNGDRLRRTDASGSDWYFVEYVPSGTRGWLSDQFVAPQCEGGS